MEQEAEPQVEGELSRDLAIISDDSMRHELETRGYGEVDKKRFYLRPFESLYLLFYGRLKLAKSGKAIGFESMLQVARKYDDDVLTKFLIYRDLRIRGYVAKEGFGFGTDLRAYDRGRFGEKASKYVVFGLKEGTQEKIGALQKKVAKITQMGKEPIIAVIERRGEVIYYKVSRIEFPPNKTAEPAVF
ncbi:tRNA splicing endonuclease [Cenarchaeum symbiosum A]|uniref:tRNA splicing endonuclease n=1 Tax=Cenarchaeum symbiosum (strain A) TaxID=414004 RepID=A0RWP7_CENSY|nr:tRNA splicing endonuclease [Cenarchaeum symbiosum A]